MLGWDRRPKTDEERRMESPETSRRVEWCDICGHAIYYGQEAWYWEDKTLCADCMEDVVEEAKGLPWRKFAREHLLASQTHQYS